MIKSVKRLLIFSLFVGFFSLVISLLGGEFIVRHLDPQPTFEQSLKEGLSIFASSEIVPFTVASSQNSIHLGYTREFNHKVATNSLGLRGARELEKQKPEGTFRILVIGDSMTFGWGVEDDETFSSVLERNLKAAAAKAGIQKKFEVINAGFNGGFTIDGFYSWLVNKGFKMKPDLVLVSFFPYNDVSDLLEMEWKKTDDLGLPTAVTSVDTMVKRGRLARRHPTEWKYVIPGIRNSHLFMLLGSALEKYSPAAVELIKKPLGVVSGKPRATREEIDKCIYDLECNSQLVAAKDKIWRLFDGIKVRAEQNGIRAEALILPSPDQTKPLAGFEIAERTKRQNSAQPQLETKSRLADMGVQVIDPLSSLSSQTGDQFFYGRDGHLNPKGHRKVAEVLFRYLLKKGEPLGFETDDQYVDLLINSGVLKF